MLNTVRYVGLITVLSWALMTCLGESIDQNTKGNMDDNAKIIDPAATSVTARPTSPSTRGIESITESKPTTTSHAPRDACAQHNDSCEDCVKSSAKCYYCYKNRRCSYYPYSHLVPRYEECGSLGDMAWGTCLINFEALIISLSVIGGVILLAITICCCCCCRKRKRKAMDRDQAQWEQQREERRLRAEERKQERQVRTDEIRRKYGLLKDDNPYQRFDS
ncbi:pituitary tumor-transforming gene 1 protein-interacting protein-like [Limulus polyphemus]|uniref:Pituitary tumor-transforming gene 1 protein-interacting protein-like n=1 Tax=Limulus polyphemus TaxID=6850 RepID=A0ABM1BSQ5_LIMPO|nr:pituitary tumor-transforming gene 1 protein-interacting protein-like [Limulus polyphemus]XP_013787928.1 pituitary tumor-transforming gene 1 protein-interacting protein-like [Limulus polyphemus]XP_022256170.1 pituitary tumor-transforming gene 1 protein-interacting protein-like [Limulus polyphemus]XP_022256171.1 pituitary tumor-transforming gene 1 protein-interacting protein-like [Limulus polyphemus]XP_022256172.1 pituitary tumor-transforming gene 1 protein-interacting protein-like [Limulus po